MGSFHRSPPAQGAGRAVLRSPVPCLQPLAQHRALLRWAGKDFGSCWRC